MKYSCYHCGAEAESRILICPWCLRTHSYGVRAVRDTPGAGSHSIATSAELAKIPSRARGDLPPGWEALMGGWDGSPSSVLLHGVRGSGKTTLALLGSHKLFASSIYLSGEEGHGATFRKKLSDYELVSTTVRVIAARQLQIAIAQAEADGAELLVIASIGIVPIVEPDIVGILSQGRSLWLICHEQKDGSQYRGPAWIGHAVDIVARVDRVADGAVHGELEKSRWGALGSFTIPI